MEADANAKPAADDKAPAEEKQKPEEPKYTSSQEQAIGSASDYLDYGSFSKKGLADQLKFEEFSKADAAFAVNHIDVDWNAAARRLRQGLPGHRLVLRRRPGRPAGLRGLHREAGRVRRDQGRALIERTPTSSGRRPSRDGRALESTGSG